MAVAFPGYRAGVVVATGLSNFATSSFAAGEIAPLDHPHLLAWRDAFRAMGAKRYLCSAEALIQRASSSEGLPAINALVDLYNAVSVKWAVPVGGEDLAGVVGPVWLRHARDGDVFDGGDPPKAPREIVWADQVGVTCRRWNWRQGVRTRLGLSTTSAYFLFDALPSFSDASLAGAMEDLSERVAAVCPEAALSSFVVREPTPAG